MLIKNVRLSFPHIFKASSYEDQDPKYSGTFIIEPEDDQIDLIKAKIEEVAIAKWGKKTPKNIKVCLRDNSEKEDMDGFEPGGMFFNANNSTRPSIFDRNRAPLVEADGKPYAGCYVNVAVEFWAQDNKYGKRINASLAGVQFDSDGDAFGGGRPASADDFPELDALPEDDMPPETADAAIADTANKASKGKNVKSSLFG